LLPGGDIEQYPSTAKSLAMAFLDTAEVKSAFDSIGFGKF